MKKMKDDLERTDGHITQGSVCGIVAGIIIVLFLMFRIFWVTSVEKHEFGYSFNRFTGKMETFTNSGWHVRTPIKYAVYTIDCRPMRITISANQRDLNAKLVRFNPEGIETFIKWHGMGAGGMFLSEILKCYAFDSVEGKDCPFLEVIQSVRPNQSCMPENLDTWKLEQTVMYTNSVSGK